jgi:hypothetical protein
MKSYRFLPFLLSAGALAAGALNLNAATSGVVGAVSVPVPAGSTIFAFPFLKPVVVQAPVSTATGSDIDLGTTIPALTGSHYLHVLSGTDTGSVYNIASVLGSVVTLEASSTNIAAADSVAIRPHMTVADLGAPANFSTITLLNPDSSVTIGTYIFGSWDISPDTVIRPGEGFVIGASSAFDLTLYGSVSEDDIIFSATGASVVGSIDPVSGASDVLSDIIAQAPNFSTLTELAAGGAVNIFTNVFGWSPDPSTIDTTNLKAFVFAPPSGTVDIVMPGNVIAP